MKSTFIFSFRTFKMDERILPFHTSQVKKKKQTMYCLDICVLRSVLITQLFEFRVVEGKHFCHSAL